MRALFSGNGPRASLLNSPGCGNGGGGGDTQAPSTPTNLAASNTTQTSTVLNWTASTDNVGVTGYNVYVNGNLVGTSNNTNYTINGLSAATTYTLSIAAYDAAGNVSGQTSINITTLPNIGGGGDADAGVRKIVRPRATSCLATFKPIVQIKNFGSTTITSVTINYSIDGDNFSRQWSGTLLPGKVKNVALAKITSSIGTHQIVATTVNPNGAGDINPTNDTKSRNYTITGFFRWSIC